MVFPAIGMLTVFLHAGLLGAVLAGSSAPLEDIATTPLRDQHGLEDSLEAHRGRALVVFVVDARRLRKIKAWERELRGRFEELQVLRVAEVPAEPTTTYERVAEKLASRVPEDVSVLIDMESRWAAVLGLDPSQPNLLLVGPDGELVAAFRGRHEPELAATVVEHVESLLAAP